MLHDLGKQTNKQTQPRIASSLSIILLKDQLINLLAFKIGANHVFTI